MDKDLKLYYSISEVAQMFDVNESLLRFLGRKSFHNFLRRRGAVGCGNIAKRILKL